VPTLPVAPSNIAVYSTLASAAAGDELSGCRGRCRMSVELSYTRRSASIQPYDIEPFLRQLR
jgi:hypothetical protein